MALNPKTDSPVLILEDDESLSNMILGELNQEGISDVDCFTDGGEAWEAMMQKQYQILLMDWKVPGLSSLAMLNRLKGNESYRQVPLVVMSGYLQGADFSLFSEFSQVAAVEKPFNCSFLFRKIKAVQAESQWYQSQEKKLTGVVKKINETPSEKESQAVMTLLDGAPNPLPIAIILGKELRVAKHYELAEQVLLKGLKFNENNVVLLSELGKIFLEQGDLAKASGYLEKADQKSPNNIERICDLGDVYLQQLETDKAEAMFNKAGELDSEETKATSGKVIAHNMGRWLAGAVSIPDTFAGILNAVGIGMVRSGSFSEGIEYYSSALNHVQSDHIKSRLAFNVGLGYLRWRKPSDALVWFKKSVVLDSENEKAGTYIHKLTSVQSKDDPSASEVATEGQEVMESTVPSDQMSFNLHPESHYTIEEDDDDDDSVIDII